jgi:hypothetical protein
MDEPKIYYPDTIEDQPLTSIAVEDVVTTGSTANKTASTGNVVESLSTIPARPIPIPVMAKELISDSLNTQSRQILSSYTFGKVGALQIGEYVSGTSGDIRISPDGITGRNSAGVTTFSIDGTTGNATFKGTIVAGSVISAEISANLITGTIVNAQIASIEWAKITNVAITNANIVSLSASKITTGTLSGINISIGTGENVFKADSNGIYLGDSTYSDAPFRVNMDGDVFASSITLENALISTGSTYQGNVISATYIGNLTAGHITSGTITVGGTNQPSALVIMESTNDGNSRLRFQRLSRIWEDNSARLGINSIGSPMFIYVDSTEVVVLQTNSKTIFQKGVRVYNKLAVGTGNNPAEQCWIEGDGMFVGNLKSNHHDPRSSNSYNLGGSSNYWAYVNCHDVSYHSLGFYDDGVTIKKNGKLQKVSDVEAIKMMKPHPTLVTKHGSPMLDKRSLPIEMFMPACRADGTEYERDAETGHAIIDDDIIYFDKNGNEKRKRNRVLQEDADGESGGQLLALALGAIRELDFKIEKLELQIKPKIK